MKLLCVVHRYGPGVAGGSEAHCRAIAQHLAAEHEVTVVTSCAEDYITWADVFPPGESRDGAVKVVRFPVARRRALRKFWALSDRVFDERATAEEQREWFVLNGPEAPGLLEFLRAHGREYDRVLFWAFRYYPTWFGLPLVADRAILLPTAEDDEIIRSASILGPFFSSPRAFLFLTPEERQLVASRTPGPLAPSEIIGAGLDPAPPAPPHGALDSLGIPRDFLLYLGRVDKNKGCDELFANYLAYARDAGPGAPPLPLILAGPALLPVPDHPLIRAVGRVDDAVRDALLAQARALLMPSPYESLSLVVLEAWNRGTPVIVNGRCRPLRGQVRRADGGLYYEHPDEFRVSVARLAGDRELAHAFGAQGLRYVETNYRWPHVMGKVEAALRW
jgi:glycosyltransferase involved in cell wall biosynthesis